MTAFDRSAALRIIEEHRGLEGPLLPILHGLQAAFGYIPPEAQPLVAEALNLSRAEVHGVISFYHDFRTEPAGRVVVKLCRAEACQAMGAREAGAALLQHLAIGWGETTKDGAVTVEPVYCLGLCAVAPAALIDGEPAARFGAAELVARVEAAR
jgi:formate dehydrogenase subunit gamma